MSHPNTHLRSSDAPSPSNLQMLVGLSLGMGSASCVGRNMQLTASGAAFCPFWTQFLSSTITVMISSIYPSAIAGRKRTSTSSSLAFVGGGVLRVGSFHFISSGVGWVRECLMDPRMGHRVDRSSRP